MNVVRTKNTGVPDTPYQAFFYFGFCFMYKEYLIRVEIGLV